jgi:hypothetical protein
MRFPKPARPIDSEVAASCALLAAVLTIGFVTVGDYGITSDEFLFDAYGPKALAWYLSGFTDRTWFDYLDERPYGPWFQMLVTAAQSLGLAERFAVRHAVTFVIGIGGLVALLPLAGLTVGRWAGFSAIVLCLITGNLYGHLFFSPNDVPFMATMTWATLAVIVMARDPVPSWGVVAAVGLLTGLAIASRPGGVLVQIYLLAAMALCVLEDFLARRDRIVLRRTGVRTAVAIVAAWPVAIALWPFLQVQNPVAGFAIAFAHFANIGLDFPIWHWGQRLSTAALPWTYVPGELLARLPTAFIALLAVAAACGGANAFRLLVACANDRQRQGRAGMLDALSALARNRAMLLLAMAAFAPLAFVMVTRPIIFDGIRHFLFTIPLLALFAAWGLLRLLPLVRHLPYVCSTLAGAYIAAAVATMAVLHPLEYVATNVLAGGVARSVGRFDLDYWLAAATEALRRLEQRVAYDAPERFRSRTPSIHICIPWREQWVAPMFRRPWKLELDPQKADYVIETERSHCAPRSQAVLIDEVKRFDHAFAWTYENRTATGR